MKTRLLNWAMMLLLAWAMVPRALARPQFAFLNAEGQKDETEALGYHVTAVQKGDDVEFSIDVDPTAAAALRSAQIYYLTEGGKGPEVKIQIRETPDHRKHLSFRIPTGIAPQSMLHLDSGILRSTDPDRNFSGYRIFLKGKASAALESAK